MYIPVEPFKMVNLESGSIAFPIATLKDEFDGEAHIIIDDGCYVLLTKNLNNKCIYSSHWFREAITILRQLPTDPADIDRESWE